MTDLYRAQLTFPHRSGLAKDQVVNTFHFDGPEAPTQLQKDALVTILNQFYTQTHTPGTGALNNYLSGSLNGANARVKLYKMAHPAPRIPLIDTITNIPTTAVSTPLPEEVAVVGSYRAEVESGVNNRRRKGRIFFGPLLTGALSETNEKSRPSTLVRNAILGSMDWLRTHPSTDWTWVQYSPTDDPAGTGSFGSWSAVQVVAVDDAFDIQRRRGAEPTQRQVLPAGAAW